ncbi:unnamed protein product [Pleuronectes platessa]|uniref:Uncharacterized protein n=1 Tax=Pleuronectes platessa TaxID=8262 RepID=A0A9N7TQV2_PLEPL|nr:unnamed protein product [Pleuronectes platessa]
MNGRTDGQCRGHRVSVDVVVPVTPPPTGRRSLPESRRPPEPCSYTLCRSQDQSEVLSHESTESMGRMQNISQQQEKPRHWFQTDDEDKQADDEEQLCGFLTPFSLQLSFIQNRPSGPEEDDHHMNQSRAPLSLDQSEPRARR